MCVPESVFLRCTDFQGIDLTALSSISATLIKSMEAPARHRAPHFLDLPRLYRLVLCVPAVGAAGVGG